MGRQVAQGSDGVRRSHPGAAGDGGSQRRSRRIARLLAPGAWALGGFASAEARVDAGLGLLLRPDVLVALGDPPPDGVLHEPPLLVVALRDVGVVGAWLAVGAQAVWTPHDQGACCWLAGGTITTVPPTGLLDVPGYPGLTLAAGEVTLTAASTAVLPPVSSSRRSDP